MASTVQTSSAALKAGFLSQADLARLLALNAAIEAPRMGEAGTRFAAAAGLSAELLRRAVASSEEVATLVRGTLGSCMLHGRR